MAHWDAYYESNEMYAPMSTAVERVISTQVALVMIQVAAVRWQYDTCVYVYRVCTYAHARTRTCARRGGGTAYGSQPTPAVRREVKSTVLAGPCGPCGRFPVNYLTLVFLGILVYYISHIQFVHLKFARCYVYT